MDGSIISEWLNSVFSKCDYVLLSYLYEFAQKTNGIFTDALKAVGLFSENGIVYLLAGLVFICFKKTRKTGICLFGAVGCSGFIALVLKDLIRRPRPFSGSVGYNEWWQYLGAQAESGFSFPSGHTTLVMAAATALFLSTNKKISWMFFLFAMLTGISRCYLIVHYPSDILGGMLTGLLGAIFAFYITRKLDELYNHFQLKHLERNKG